MWSGTALICSARTQRYLSHVVRFDLPRLGSIADLDVVHLQCHIGTDTLSLPRLGARSVTGLDFSRPALEAATRLAVDCGASIDYVESELYDAVGTLGPAGSTWCTQGSGHYPGCLTCVSGPRSWPPFCGLVAGCSCVKVIRCSGR